MADPGDWPVTIRKSLTPVTGGEDSRERASPPEQAGTSGQTMLQTAVGRALKIKLQKHGEGRTNS